MIAVLAVQQEEALVTPEVRLQVAAATLAEELNFTRAAERLSITQPALSKQISDLESQLGFSIFLRGHRHVELTNSGQIFIRGCQDAFAILEKAIRSAKATHDSIEPLVTIGHSPYVDPALIACLLAVHLPLFPGLRLRMESMFAHDLAHGVLAGELDLAIISEPPGNPQLTSVPLATAPLCVAMPSDHPASKKQNVNIEDFANAGWIVFPRKAHPGIYDRVMAAARQAETTPVELHHYVNPQESLPLIHENFGIAILAKGVADQIRDGQIAVRPFATDTLRVSSFLVLHADQSSRLVNDFGRAFLRKIGPNILSSSPSGQLLLGL